MSKQDELIAYVFDRKRNVLSGTLKQWMDQSTRFTAFVETYRDKIRKKVRVIREAESALDLRGELEVAYCLLNDRHFGVEYEPYASAKTRGPDFAVTYRANLVFNTEVARIRGEENGAEGTDLPRKEGRVVRILLDKLGQMQPGMANLLAIHVREELVQSIDLAGLMQALKTIVEARDPAFSAATHYATPAAFYKDFLHLSGILLWSSGSQLWINKQAKPGLDEKVARRVSSLLSGAPDA